MNREIKTVVVGTSMGGYNAIKQLLAPLPENFSLPIIIVQHLASDSSGYWWKQLDKICQLNVKEANEKEEIQPGFVYVAPANYHLLIETNGTFSLSVHERVSYARPSIDVLFESAAFAYQQQLLGIILTGANHDGTAGLKTIQSCGGMTIAQDPETAESPFMPQNAIRKNAVDIVLPLHKIIHLLIDIDEMNKSKK